MNSTYQDLTDNTQPLLLLQITTQLDWAFAC